MQSAIRNFIKFRLADILLVATVLLATGSASVVLARDAAPVAQSAAPVAQSAAPVAQSAAPVTKSSAPAAQSASAAETAPAPSDYRLGPGDKVRVIVFDEDQLTGEYFVSDAGNVSLPLIGALPAAGHRLDQFRAEVEAAYQKGYLKDPKVAVEVLIYRPFYILGEVNKAGEYPYTHALTVLDAVATAEGFTYRANTHIVFIKHANEAAEHKEKLHSDTLVEPGDTIRIAERFF